MWTWLWKDIIAWKGEHNKVLMQWYSEESIPKFKAHERDRKEGMKYVVAGGGFVCRCS